MAAMKSPLFTTPPAAFVTPQDDARLQELEALYSAINQSQAVLEMDIDGTVLMANTSYLKMFGYTLAEIQGKSYSLFVEPAARESAEYRDLWEHLRGGQHEQGRFARIGKNAREVWVRASFNPLLGRDGKVFKVVKFASEITSIIEEARRLDRAVHESQNVIRAVLAGATDRRIVMTGKTGNLALLAASINELIDGVSATVTETEQVLQRAIEGDLTSRIQLNDKSGHLRTLAESVNSMIKAMMDVVASLKRTSREVHEGAEEISRGNLNLSRRIEKQALSLEETASSMDEITAIVKNNADNAAQARDLAATAGEQAERGSRVVGAVVVAMSDINAASKKIADIIGVINEIAFQTNILALNAAVEAARAGEHGRGFAVVASEVRNLASRSAGAAKQIKALIQDSVDKVDEGAKLVDESGKVLGEIVTRVKKVTGVMAEIANASREQATGIEHVNKAVASMEAVTQQNAALVEEASAAAQAMTEQAKSLTNLISHYREPPQTAQAPADSGTRRKSA